MILPTLRQLQYLIAVVDLGHFGKAAERCHVTQSTLSAGIRELEDLLQTQLIERTRRSVRITPLGAEVAEKARGVLDSARDITELVQAEQSPLSGRMRLGVIPTIGPYILPRILSGLRQAYPDLRLYLREEQTAILLSKLNRGELEVALIALPFETGALASLTLGPDPFWLALPTGHELAAERVIDPSRIPSEEMLLLEDGHCLRDHALAACGIKSAAVGAYQGNSLHTLIEMVANGLGVTFVPEIALSTGLRERDDLVLRPLGPAGGGTASRGRQLGLVWRQSYRRENDVAALAAYMRGALAKFRMPSG